MEEITGQQDERLGLQVSLIGMTAAGDVIEFRLNIIDPDKT